MVEKILLTINAMHSRPALGNKPVAERECAASKVENSATRIAKMF
jgi:hypothetical protein